MKVVYYYKAEFILGTFYLAATENGLCRIDFPGKCEKDFFSWLSKNFDYLVNEKTYIIEQAIVQLKEYFEGNRKEFSVPLDLIGTDFQKKVWKELMNIPYGQVDTYGHIAALLGNPKAGRAVGGANNKNPVPIIVPCHRVIGSNGKLVGYAGGLDIKKRLLVLERRTMTEHLLYDG